MARAARPDRRVQAAEPTQRRARAGAQRARAERAARAAWHRSRAIRSQRSRARGARYAPARHRLSYGGSRMLVVSRRADGSIEITLLGSNGRRVKMGIEAPPELSIRRVDKPE